MVRVSQRRQRCQSYPGIKMHALEPSKKVRPVGWCRAPKKVTAINCFLIQKCNLSMVLDQEKVFVCVCFSYKLLRFSKWGDQELEFFGTCWCLVSRKSKRSEYCGRWEFFQQKHFQLNAFVIWRAFLTSKNLTKDGEMELVLLESWTWRATTMNGLPCGYRFNIRVRKKKQPKFVGACLFEFQSFWATACHVSFFRWGPILLKYTLPETNIFFEPEKWDHLGFTASWLPAVSFRVPVQEVH